MSNNSYYDNMTHQEGQKSEPQENCLKSKEIKIIP